MLQLEEAQYGSASMAQVDQFITEEFNGTGGKLSNGSILLSEATACGDGNGYLEIPGYQINLRISCIFLKIIAVTEFYLTTINHLP